MVEIDKHKVYKSHDYLFKNFIMMNDEEKRMVLKWRNDDSVRRWMYSAKQATEEEHFNYIKTLEGKDDRWYWIVFKKDLPVGVLVLALHDREKGIYEHGIYMNPDLYGGGFGLFKEINIFLFCILCIKKLCGSVQSDNKDAFYLDLFFGMNFTGKIIIPQEGVDVEYLECPLYIIDDFAPHKDATLSEYIKFVKNLKKNN